MSGTLGAILAGGQARRFGSDKALAQLDGVPLIERALAALAPQVDALLVCGRPWAAHRWVADRPQAGLGPLGGIAAALRFAADAGFDWVVTSACDVPMLPADLVARLAAGEGAAFVTGLPVVARWPAAASGALDQWLAEDRSRAVRAFAAHIGAPAVTLPRVPDNINTPADLAAKQGVPYHRSIG